MAVEGKYDRYRYRPAVTPADGSSAEFAVCDAFYVGGGGDLAILNEDGEEEIIEAVTDCSMVPFGGTRVLATGTSATKIRRCYWYKPETEE